jgi:hypothetical protein
MSAPTVIVDAENVRRSVWPNMTREELVTRSCSWGEEHGHPVLIVFDGPAPKVETDAECTLVGSGGATADEWIVANADELAPYWLVTSDRELRALAGRNAERVIGGGSFARELA